MKSSNKSSLIGAVGALALSTLLLSAIAPDKSEASIIESVTESVDEANGIEAERAKGGSSCNKLENVSTFEGNSIHPVRGGKQAFRHWVNRCGERSELNGTKLTKSVSDKTLLT